MNIPFIKSGNKKKVKEINMLLGRLKEIADAIEPIDHQMMCEFDTSLRDLIKVMRVIGADEEFVRLDGLKALSDDDGCGDEGMPYRALVKSLRKFELDGEDNPVMYPCEIFSRIYGLILSLEEYRKYYK